MAWRSGLTRRGFGALSLGAATVGLSDVRSSLAAAEAPEWRHALSLLGLPKHPADFPHFPYVRPDAPKGGLVRLGQQGTFDNFNLFVSGVKGELEAGIGALLHDTLMSASQDEVATQYGQIALAVSYPEDRSHVTYRLNPAARFHDGSAITVEDVIFSFDTLKRASPLYTFYYQNVVKAEASGPGEVTFSFSQAGNRELPQIVGELPVLSKTWWSAPGADGRPRHPEDTTLERPLGCGPYRLAAFEAGRYALYERVRDHWAADRPVNRGTNNFDQIRFEYFRDSTVMLEAFKGDAYDFRTEASARDWATAYAFPAAAEGRVVREEFPVRNTGVMQGFAFNLRRPKFADPRVRRAFNLAFDFEDMNRTLFYGLYERIDSWFYGTELASSGVPAGLEREILRRLGDKVPARLFIEPYVNPLNGTPESVRVNLRQAVNLLREAGYDLKGRQMVATSGEPLRVEILGFDANAERFVLPYRQALERIGITVDLRVVDGAQYQNRLRAYDFDMTTSAWPQSLSPGNEQREFFGSAAADRPGSRNIIGIKNAAVDALVDTIIFAPDRDTLVAATRALDRVLLAQNYVVPQWTSRVSRTARWNRFGHPGDLPEFGGSAFPGVWWYDAALAAKTGAAR